MSMPMPIRTFNVANNSKNYYFTVHGSVIQDEKQNCHNNMPGNDLWKGNVFSH